MPLPLAMMIPFMGIQSAVMAKQFGENFQYGKRRISAMSNEEFNKLTPTKLMQRANEELKDMIPTMKSSIVEMRDFQTFLIGEFIRMVNDAIGKGLGTIFGFDPKTVFPDQGEERDYFDPGNPDKDFIPGNPQPPTSTFIPPPPQLEDPNTEKLRARSQKNLAEIRKPKSLTFSRQDIVQFKNFQKAGTLIAQSRGKNAAEQRKILRGSGFRSVKEAAIMKSRAQKYIFAGGRGGAYSNWLREKTGGSRSV